MSSDGARQSPRVEAQRRVGLRPDELARYGRHLTLPEFGLEGQQRLKAARVAVVGLGGLGSPAALYLAAAGIGTMGLIDGDRVDLTNLQRQVLYDDADVGSPKVDVASRRLARMNPDVQIRSFATRLDSGNALEILQDFDIVLDGSDNFPTRYLVNDATVLLGIPSVHGSVLRFEGRISLFGTENGPCYRCLYPEPPPPGVVQDCQDAGVLGVMPGLIGVLQATEVIKTICRLGESLAGRLLIVDGLGLRFRTFSIAKNPACPACSTRALRALIDYEAFCGTGTRVPAVSPSGALQHLTRDTQVLDVRERWEFEIGHLPGARLVPLAQLENHLATLDPGRDILVYCHHGSRSAAAVTRLQAAGFTRVSHLEGGIDRWSAEVDDSIARY
ncbi:MAG TPA: molybdopterin-synthase adenylyltransferase MoeB [Gemmatimonadaceae bacterium]|nr:molybdopterin-synthase adenylyltransferase MoeB [Gemmatimonadaceae bacterium]